MKPLLIVLILQLSFLQVFPLHTGICSTFTAVAHVEYYETAEEISDSQSRISEEMNLGSTHFFNISSLIFIIVLVFVSGLGIIAYIRFYEKKKINQQLEKEILTKTESERKLKLSEAKFKEANATKDKFFSILSHDLKSPFAAMLGMTEILEKEYHQLKESDRIILIKELGKATINTYALLEELLSWSQSQRGLLEFNPQPVDLLKLCTESIELVSTAATSKSISIKCLVDKAVVVNADHNMLETVLRNLLTNAVKFTNQGGEIKIHTRESLHKPSGGSANAMVSVVVTDNGVGISQQNIEKLLKVEDKYKTAGTEKETGTGLGLIICKEFIEKHGGEISIESEEGKGSSFGFTIPPVEKSTL